MEVDHRRHPDAALEAPVYSATARFFHWVTVIGIALQIPLGIYMVRRGAATNFDAATNTLYSGHKLLGFALLWFVALRLIYRLVHGAPPDEPTLAWWQKGASHFTHWGLYLLLLGVPFLGWLGVSYYGALGTFGGWSLPAIAEQDQEKAHTVFRYHFLGALLILVAIAVHIGAAIYHHFFRRDGVLRRMLPGLRQRN